MLQKISELFREAPERDIFLTNTLTKKKDVFIPISKKQLMLYTCGPTVYSEPQIGNLRAYVFSDTLRRMFEVNGYFVHQVINITDVGHLVSDADAGEDKMEKAARERKEKAQDIAERYTKIFFENLSDLNIKTSGTSFPRATEFIKEQIVMIRTLEEKGYTYTTSDGVYFNTALFPRYGALGGINLDGLQAGARVAVSDEKKNPTDFALWKFSPKDGAAREQEWESPWGIGFPGWHIECSAMSRALLGKHIDIHTGGIDHIPVHHNNEIAQSECASGEQFVNVWMHNAFLTINGDRIGKSVGNAITLRELITAGYDPLALRYLYLTSHYSTPMDFTWESLKASETALKRLQKLSSIPGGVLQKSIIDQILSAYSNDLHTAQGIALIWDMMNNQKISDADKAATLRALEPLCALSFGKEPENVSIPPHVAEILQKRAQARLEKDWTTSDVLREALAEQGFVVKDDATGQTLEKKQV